MGEFAQYLSVCCHSATNMRRVRGFLDTLLRKTVLTGRVRAFLARRGRPTHDPARCIEIVCILSIARDLAHICVHVHVHARAPKVAWSATGSMGTGTANGMCLQPGGPVGVCEQTRNPSSSGLVKIAVRR